MNHHKGIIHSKCAKKIKQEFHYDNYHFGWGQKGKVLDRILSNIDICKKCETLFRNQFPTKIVSPMLVYRFVDNVPDFVPDCLISDKVILEWKDELEGNDKNKLIEVGDDINTDLQLARKAKKHGMTFKDIIFKLMGRYPELITEKELFKK